ncbi:putative secreted protein (Por secretion system target) [Tenacibaculum adriaticum]|uniref:Putative secreted protein (Por secretion system target) n=1 Tax=Tenacibaculum adriaticum TaxID=413713 RepID=A0A5S5DWJ6_9FLAO|nr:T9SS type A sorting domain-containing protein [Tenacibaculum adriaticum]TYQ00196.1 putative secreted protein (Por secretion system target) [Tenacibaculum adriaticum]
MKKITFLFTFFILSTINAQTTFDWDTPVPSVDTSAGTVTQVKEGITTIFTGVVDEVNVSDGAGFAGSTGNIISSASATFASSVTFTFSEPVNITSILAIDATNFEKDWTFTPTGGANSPVTATLAALDGTSVNLNWTGVTGFTVTSTLTGTLGGDIFVFDNLVAAASFINFDWDTPAPNTNASAGTITQTKAGVTATFTGVANEANVSDGAGFAGSTGNIISSASATFAPSVTFTFNEPVDINSVLAIDATNFEKDWTFTPVGGANSPVTTTLAALNGTSANLNWTGVTGFTVTSTLTATLGGDIFVFDNLIIATSNSTLSTTNYITETIKMYPNPVDNILYLKNIGNLKGTKIYNSLGQLVSETKKEEIDFSNFNKGIYFLQVNSDKGVETKKIIKK